MIETIDTFNINEPHNNNRVSSKGLTQKQLESRNLNYSKTGKKLATHKNKQEDFSLKSDHSSCSTGTSKNATAPRTISNIQTSSILGSNDQDHEE